MTIPNKPYPHPDDPNLIDRVCVDCKYPCRVLATDETPRCPFCAWDRFCVEHPAEAAVHAYYTGLAARGFAAIVNEINSGRRAV